MFVKVEEPIAYRERADVEVVGRKLNILDLSHEVSAEMPHYPGHMKTSFWWHLTHDESKLRMSETEFEGYGVRGIVTCEHVSTHVDAIYHFNKQRPDLTVDKIPIEYMFTPAAWIDVSDVLPRTHITLDRVKRALDEAEVTIQPGSTLLYYTGVDRHWNDAMTFVSQYPGLDGEATDWILDQGVVNVGTDAVSLDNPADTTYPNHLRHGERLVLHTENLAHISDIPKHQGFTFSMFPWKLTGATGCPIRAFAMWD